MLIGSIFEFRSITANIHLADARDNENVNKKGVVSAILSAAETKPKNI